MSFSQKQSDFSLSVERYPWCIFKGIPSLLYRECKVSFKLLVNQADR